MNFMLIQLMYMESHWTCIALRWKNVENEKVDIYFIASVPQTLSGYIFIQRANCATDITIH